MRHLALLLGLDVWPLVDVLYNSRLIRSALDAVNCFQQYINEAYHWVVDMDLEKLFIRRSIW